jgi:hypothetical protein
MNLNFNGEKIKIAEDITEEAYQKISIESFGKLMLNNMKKTSNSFLTQKRKPQELIEFKIKNTKVGLGYKQEEKTYKNGKVQTFSFYGQNISIEKGEFKGQKGKILIDKKYESINQLLKENDYILVELDINGQKHEIKNNFIKIVKSEERKEMEEKPTILELNENKEENKREKIQWIKPNIIIRIIDENSKYYNTKAKVEDIISDNTFSLLTYDNTLHTEFTEDECETYIPKINETVLILNGEYENKKGKLISRDKNKDIVSVLLYDDLISVNLAQDDICAISQ